MVILEACIGAVVLLGGGGGGGVGIGIEPVACHRRMRFMSGVG